MPPKRNIAAEDVDEADDDEVVSVTAGRVRLPMFVDDVVMALDVL